MDRAFFVVWDLFRVIHHEVIGVKIAYDADGNLIYATKGQKLDVQAMYYCPDCQKRLQCCRRKDGSYYFRHCSVVQHEGETNAHQQGKSQLRKQLLTCGIEAQLEKYETAIDQRPDISFTWQENEWALEYQCSVIHIQEMIHRTEALETLGKKVWWILGEKLLQKNYGDMLHYCLRYHPKLGDFICFYRQRQFVIHHHVQMNPVKQEYQYRSSILPIEKVDWQRLLAMYQEAKELQQQPLLGIWTAEEVQVLKLSTQEEVRQFFQQLYLCHLAVEDLPQACLKKPRYSWSIKSLRLIWTGYLFLALLEWADGERFTIHQCYEQLVSLIRQKRVRRTTCYHWKQVCLQELEQFLEMLCEEGVIHQIDRECWCKVSPRRLKK